MSTYINGKRVRLMMNGKKYSLRHSIQEINEEDKIAMRYVSLGDSIAVGHSIDANWKNDYGYHTQYGENGNESTVIVPNSYTDLIHKKLLSIYGDDKVLATSYAHSGDTNTDLRDKLENPSVQESIANADVITICIGANTILGPATSEIGNFINYGNPTLLQLNEALESGFNMLASDENVYGSYRNIMAKIKSLNNKPTAKFIFTTVYNPYKFLWLDESTDGNDYIDGYFGPVFWAVPNVEINIPLVGQMGMRKFVYESAYIPEITSRINNPAGNNSYSLGEWVEGKIDRLNEIIKQAVSLFDDQRFSVADTKPIYESYPDKYVRSDYNYSDLVNVEIVKGQTVEDLDWGRFWNNLDVNNLSNIVSEIVEVIRKEVIEPDIDPHPETDGQYALYRSFANVLEWEALNRYAVSYYANGGSGSMAMQEVVSIGYDRLGRTLTAYTVAKKNEFTPNKGHYFTGWNTKADGSGTGYSNGQSVEVNRDITLYARWSNMYTVAWKKTSNNEYVSPSGQTGPVMKNGSEYYLKVLLGGSVIPGLNDAFDSSGNSQVHSMQVPYGTRLDINLINTGSYDRGYAKLNGVKQGVSAEYYNFSMEINHDTAMIFYWEHEIGSWTDGFEIQDYWIADINEYPK